MKKKYVSKKVLHACLLFFMIIATNMFAQVGIGTTLPDASSVLDVTSTTQGMLTPRMTTAQRSAIVSPANGLIVYDTDLKSFFNYNTSISNWDIISSSANGRLNFKRIKSTDVLATVLAAEKAAGGGSKYLLNANTLYEINGTVVADLPIELNNCYLTGLDSGEDKLVKLSGDLFVGTTGGSIRVLTLVSSVGNVFNITGDGTPNLIFRDCIVANSSNVGLLKGFSMIFVSIVQYIGNTNGITYENVSRLLLSNTGWFGGGTIGNSGTYEKLVGTFGFIGKQGGFSEVTGTNVGLDVSSNPIITGDAVMESVVFSGSNTVGYVKGYFPALYTGYNFNNKWDVRCAGIPTEGDSGATGDINLDAAIGSGVVTTFSGTGSGSRIKVNGNTTSNSLFRFTKDGNNKITYRGNKTRYFQISASVSYQGSAADMTLILYFAKNGVVLTDTKVYGRPSTGFFSSSGILALPIVGTVQLKKDDFIEIWAERNDGSGNISTVSLNLTAR